MSHEERTLPKITQKWGFGMAPPKPTTQQCRERACANLLETISSRTLPPSNENLLQMVSEVKGMFTRIVRRDQWDWFTVSGQLGYPPRRVANLISQELMHLRMAIKTQSTAPYNKAQKNLRRLPTRRCLSVFLGRAKIKRQPGAGWIYILSTREIKDLLKIGMTTRTVEQRVSEINRVTGVAIPFGVLCCWQVSNPKKVEKLIHNTLSEFRLRGDREFFQVPFPVAAQKIETVIRENSVGLPTMVTKN